jgi:GR25 family glycosyltransferase involved in LPS biosynthesis
MKKRSKKVAIILLCQSIALYADVEDYLKKIDRCPGHRMQNIDYIYLINLDERPEKLCRCLEKLAPYGILPHRFSAINGWQLSIETINELGVKFGPWMQGAQIGGYYIEEIGHEPQHESVEVIGRTYFGPRVYPGAIACALSHLSVLQHAYDSGFETVWIMEDDIEILKDPGTLSDLIDKLDHLVKKDGWDILFTDKDTKDRNGTTVPCYSYGWRPNYTPKDTAKFGQVKIISPEFRQIGARYGTYSMIVRRSGMKKILNFIKQYQLFLPLDMELTQPPGMRLFTVLEDVVSTEYAAPTDNTAANYKNRALSKPTFEEKKE